jgi:Domain of unknown function (DUF3127)
MEITGTLVQVNEPITGQGKNGMWKKQEFIIETPGQYPKKVMITAWGDKINLAAIKPGSQVTVGFDLESREYNGRWYTDVKAWKVAPGAGSATGQSEPNSMMPPPPSFDNGGAAVDDDLPF